MVAEHAELPPHLLPFGVAGECVVRPGHVADIDRDVPRERGAALVTASFRMAEGLLQAEPAEGLIGPDVGVTENPQPQRSLLH